MNSKDVKSSNSTEKELEILKTHDIFNKIIESKINFINNIT
jgi:hypothetical protein